MVGEQYGNTALRRGNTAMADQIGGRMIYWGSELIIGKMGRTHAPTFQRLRCEADDDNSDGADSADNVFDPLDDADIKCR